MMLIVNQLSQSLGKGLYGAMMEKHALPGSEEHWSILLTFEDLIPTTNQPITGPAGTISAAAGCSL
jgi:hypothetical protein